MQVAHIVFILVFIFVNKKICSYNGNYFTLHNSIYQFTPPFTLFCKADGFIFIVKT